MLRRLLAQLVAWLSTLAGRFIDGFPALLARYGLVDREKSREALDLAAPVMVTGGLRIFLRIADFAMVGLALGDAAIAGLELGFQYYFIGFGLSLAVTSGTISVVSRLQGADEEARANLAVKQSLWLAILISLPLTAASWLYAEPLVGILTDDESVIRLGGIYLSIVMLSLAPRFWSMVAARALAGSADTRTPMYVRLLTLPTNVVINAVLIFGLGPAPRLGIAGAAIGTAAANTLAAVVFFGLLVSGRYVVTLPLGGRQFDLGLMTEIVRVALPLSGMRLLQTFARFPFLFVLGVLGTPTVAAFAIGRRVMLLALMPAWGYSTAASTLVGQYVGAGDDDDATAYGWQTLRIALITQLLIAVVLVAFARPISLLFGTEYPDLTVTFIRVFALAVAGFSVSRTMRGSLRGAGDTRWPLYGTFVGSYLYRIPVAILALPVGFAVTVPLVGISIAPGLGWGLPTIFAAIVGDYYVKAAVNTGRFWTGKWRAVARASGVGADD
jgi:putative MATE family efflux protein